METPVMRPPGCLKEWFRRPSLPCLLSWNDSGTRKRGFAERPPPCWERSVPRRKRLCRGSRNCSETRTSRFAWLPPGLWCG